jgi:uncharacterized protein (DUF849 family)
VERNLVALSGAACTERNHDWERPFLEGTRTWIFPNTFADIETIVTEMSQYGTRFEFECYDVGHLYNLAYFLAQGVLASSLSFRRSSASTVGSEPLE